MKTYKKATYYLLVIEKILLFIFGIIIGGCFIATLLIVKYDKHPSPVNDILILKVSFADIYISEKDFLVKVKEEK